jgi:hypothetical protein
MLYKASLPHCAALAPLIITSHLISLIKTITPAANLAWHSHPNPLNPIKSPKPLSSPRSAHYSSAVLNHETPPHLQTHTAMCGTSFNFTESDLTATVAAYNPSLHEAPMVIGHPQHDAPAAGWVKSLSAPPKA